MKFKRLKDRAAVVYPQSEGHHVSDGAERQKRYKEVNIENVDWDDQNLPPPSLTMDHCSTTIRRKEKYLISHEKQNRIETSPCIEDLLKIREKHLKHLAHEKKLEKRRQEQKEELSKLEEALEKGNLDTTQVEDDPVTADSDDEDATQEEFKKRQLVMKEKRLVFTRASKLIHTPMSAFKRVRYAGWVYWKKNKIKREKSSQILPWMFVGDRSMAANQNYLVGQGFTHILNVTTEVKNYFPEKFVYLRIPIRDKEQVNLSERYRKVFLFIQRVAETKGKLYVHCSAGSSRAPAIVMAYLIAVRKIALLDAFDYMVAVRTCVSPNAGFLYQLAELEVKEGLGSSVLFKKKWDSYDFNLLKRLVVPERRKSVGVMKTAWRLHHPLNIEYDHIEVWELERRRKAILEAKGIEIPCKEYFNDANDENK